MSKDDSNEFDVSLVWSSADLPIVAVAMEPGFLHPTRYMQLRKHLAFMMCCNDHHDLIMSVLQNLSTSMSSSLAA